jgi:hypothetical protein
MAWPESRPDQALFDELAGIRVELRFASLGAEVVRLAVVLAAAGCLRRIYLHPANDVLLQPTLAGFKVEGCNRVPMAEVGACCPFDFRTRTRCRRSIRRRGSFADKGSLSDQPIQRALSAVLCRPLFELLFREDCQVVRFGGYSAAIQSMLYRDSANLRQHIAVMRDSAPAMRNDFDRSKPRSPDARRESRPVGTERGSKRTRLGRTVLYWMVRFERIVVLAPRSRARGKSP